MISTDGNPLSKENYSAFVECRERLTGKLVFRLPSPALTQRYISPDEQYIAGLSNIKLWNPVRFVLFAMGGQVVSKRAFGGMSRNELNIPIA